jgi:hypothetical protein
MIKVLIQKMTKIRESHGSRMPAHGNHMKTARRHMGVTWKTHAQRMRSHENRTSACTQSFFYRVHFYRVTVG